jgi:hypothetical protein
MAAISSNATPPRSGWDSRFEILGQPAAEQQKASVKPQHPAPAAMTRAVHPFRVRMLSRIYIKYASFGFGCGRGVGA